MYYLRLHIVLLVVVGVLAGCARSGPTMTVLGVKAPQAAQFQPKAKVFVEVYNPSGQTLQLHRLEYRLRADDWLDTNGKIHVERRIGAGTSSVLEIQVPIEGDARQSLQGVPFRLDAKLYARTDKTERSWKLKATGELASGARTGIQVAER